LKAVWKGYLGFGLVNIPVALYSAVDDEQINFHLFHEKDNGRIKYNRVCSECGEEISWVNIIKGVEIGKNNFYMIAKEEINELKPKGDDLIEIQEFIDKDQISQIYFTRHYYIGPTDESERPYFLFKETLEDSNKAAIATFVLREKEYTCIVINYKEGLLLSILNYSNQIRDIKNVPNLDDKPDLKQKEKLLARELIDKLTTDKINLEKYRDTFTESLKEMIMKKAEGELISGKAKKISGTENLIEALEASISK
jgi:DNA end-binding protein Ku